MPRLYVANREKLDSEVEATLARLPDDYWVLAETNLRRNHDLIIIRPMAPEPAVLIAVEVKRVSNPLRGTVNGPWEELVDGAWRHVETSNTQDANYYWQAVNAANSLAEWLRNQAPVFNEGEAEPWSNTRVWPDLLLLSPAHVRHQLPLRPDSRYGAWFFDLEQWEKHLVGWRSKVGPVLTDAHVERLVRHLGLRATARDDRQASATENADLPARVARLEARYAALAAEVGELKPRLAALTAQWPVLVRNRPGPPVEVFHSVTGSCGRVRDRDRFDAILRSEATARNLRPCSACDWSEALSAAVGEQ